MTAEYTEVEANGMRFETLVAGLDDGEAVLLLHGYPQSAGVWDQTMEWLAAEGYRAVAPNLRGYSPGANPADASEYTVEKLGADVIAIADALGIGRFHVVGHDWGGALAWWLGAWEPERLLSVTVLSTPHPAALAEAMRTSTQGLRSSYMAFLRVPRVPELVLGAANFAQLGASMRLSGMPRDAWRRDRAQLQRAGGIRGPLNWYRAVRLGSGRQRRVTVPALYVWGRRDPVLRRRAAELTAKWVSGPYRFEEIDAGHWIPDRNADLLRPLLAAHLAAHRAPAPAEPEAPAAPPRPRKRAAAKPRSAVAKRSPRAPRPT